MNLPPALPRTALVTGGAKRLGAVFVRALAADGFAVVIQYRESRTEAEALADEIVAAGGRATALSADLAVEASVLELAAASNAAFGPIGVLVNNASVFERDEVASTTRASWDAHIEANLRAPFVLGQSLVRNLPDDAEGAIVNLIDQRVWNLTPHFTSYTVSKAGLWTLTQTMALALAPRIRVNAIGPGPTIASARQDPAQFARQVASVPLQRGPTLDEVAATLRFILSARSMTGQMIALDGGQHLNWGAPGHHQPDE